ncbi:hypothetical protein QFC20_001374 [Naganishia adeliensis]|uniref:Uncharacterized protein n=1 Tax=Naganishia adeliensis TaxID=92952 RepID=A0ACC2WSV7_9TREE|nr:hypothetical protein QFC20_001374 [Naganishia adeliensis]
MDELDQLPTVLSLPSNLPYPITISKFLVKPGEHISRGQNVLSYSYNVDNSLLREAGDPAANSKKRKQGDDTLIAMWESSIEGEVVQWDESVREKMTIYGPGQDYLSTSQAIDVSSYGGGPSRTSRSEQGANQGIEISHDDSRVKVSYDQAHKIALEARVKLLTEKRLILVVDLDQTIIHAAVDPTIGEWLDECFGKGSNVCELRAAEGRPESGAVEARKPEETKEEGEGAKSDETAKVDGEVAGKEQTKSDNPNADAIKDVFRFQLPNELPPHLKGKYRQVIRHEDMCWYYIKPRPGLPEFLEKMSKLYEMHVYTAGSRSYANAVCKGIDPNGKYFSERILSRDESGSAAVKNLKRLFPTDQSMVVIIDDRWEVWSHGPNLVKVVPFDFFVGMGDINSTFVKPRATDVPAVRGTTPPDIAEDDDASLQDQIALKRAKALEDQVEARPLKKKQEELEKQAEEKSGDEVPVVESKDTVSTEGTLTASTSNGSNTEAPHHKQALLKNDDKELKRVDMVLREIHGRFFDALSQVKGGLRIPPSSEPDPKILFDVRHIIPHMQRKVLRGCVICFSGIIPLQQPPQENEYWILATMFGARCTRRLSSDVTHLVTGQTDTQKVAEALRKPGVKVVWRDWLKHSLDMWHRQPEEPYQIRPIAKPASTASKSDKAEFAESKTPPSSPPHTPAALSAPDTPSSDRVVPVEGDFMLDQDELEDMDKEMEELMADEDDTASETTDRDTDEASMVESRPPTPNRKRPRKSGLSEAPLVPGEDGERTTKRVRRVRDANAEADTEFVDHEEHWFEENYDEYPDEGNAPHLSDFDETDDEEDEEEAAGTAMETADMVTAELASAQEDANDAMGGSGASDDRPPPS